MIRPKLVQPAFFKNKHFRATPFFFWRSKGVQGETVGNSRSSHLRSAKKRRFNTIFKHFSWIYATKQLFLCRAKVRSPTVSNRFPLDTFGPSKKQRRCAEMLIFKKCGLNKFWPDHVSYRFRPFPTVSDRFIFSEGLIGPIPFMEGWSSAKPVRTMTLKFFWCHPCARTLHQILHLDLDIQYSLKITKSQELVKFNIMLCNEGSVVALAVAVVVVVWCN